MMSSLGFVGFSNVLHAQQPSAKKRLLVIFNKGGWDPTFVFDPHFSSSTVDSPTDATLAELGGITFADTNQRPSVRAFFNQYASQACVVNGIAVGSISHPKCEQLFLTGSRALDAPDFLAMVASKSSESQPLPYIVLSGPRIPGRYGELMSPIDELFGGILKKQYPSSASSLDIKEDLVRDYLMGVSQGRTDSFGQDFRASLIRRQNLEAYSHLFEISENPSFLESFEVASNALANELSQCAMIQLEPPDLIRWDSHSQNAYNQNVAYENLFLSLSSVMSTLEAQTDIDGIPLIETTTVAVVSEMGRTPLENGAGGKDHWPYTSALFLGAGIRGGQVVGLTDDSLMNLPVDLQTGMSSASGTMLTVPNLLGGLLSRFDIDPLEFFPNDSPFLAPFVVN